MDYKDKFFSARRGEFYKRLKSIDKILSIRKNMRQVDLAEAVEVSLSTIKRIENADTSVETGALLKTIWYLGILDQLSQALPKIKKNDVKHKRVRVGVVKDEDF